MQGSSAEKLSDMQTIFTRKCVHPHGKEYDSYQCIARNRVIEYLILKNKSPYDIAKESLRKKYAVKYAVNYTADVASNKATLYTINKETKGILRRRLGFVPCKLVNINRAEEYIINKDFIQRLAHGYISSGIPGIL